MDTTFDIIGRLIFAGGGGAVITFLILKAFAKRWLDSYFDARKSMLKAEQDKALAELKRTHDQNLKEVQALIDKDMHRARKLYDREFEVLTEALELLARAFDGAEKSIAEFVPQIHLMSDSQRTALFQSDELQPWQIEDILRFAGEKMTDRYTKLRRQKRYSMALDDSRALQRCIVLKNVFMADGLKQRFQALHDMINATLIEQKVSFDYPKLEKYDSYMTLMDGGKKLYAELEALVRERLWSVQ